MKYLTVLLLVGIWTLGSVHDVNAQGGCYNYSRYVNYYPSYPSYYSYPQSYQYVPSYYTYYSPYNYYQPAYYGSTSASETSANIAAQVVSTLKTAQEKAEAAETNKQILELLKAIRAQGGNVPPELFKKQPQPQPEPPPNPTPPIQPQSQTSVKTEVDPKWTEVVANNCLSCHSGKMDKKRNGNLDLSDLTTVSYLHRLASVNKIARKLMPKDKPPKDEVVGPWSGLASDWAEAAAQALYAKKE